MRYSLRQLEVFLATAASENISRAAAGLAVGAVNQAKKKRAQSNHETVSVDDFKEEA